MLKITVHRPDIRRETRLRALDEGRGQAAPADTMDQPDPGIEGRHLGDRGARAIPAVVVDEHDFPGDAGQRRIHAGDERRDVALLVENGDDDAEVRHDNHRGKLAGPAGRDNVTAAGAHTLRLRSGCGGGIRADHLSSALIGGWP